MTRGQREQRERLGFLDSRSLKESHISEKGMPTVNFGMSEEVH